jgi:7-cyano-7-deazaguanine synthase
MNDKMLSEFDLVILFSGGADSMLLLQLALALDYTPLCVMTDYGQKHIKELDYAKNQLTHFGVAYRIVKLENYTVNSGLTGDNVPGKYGGVNEMNVPGRNTVFIGIAAGIAESEGVDEIWFGADFSDRINKFPDCFQEFTYRMNEVLKVSGSYPMKLRAPLLGLTKEMVIGLLTKTYGVSMQNVYSGYEEVE